MDPLKPLRLYLRNTRERRRLGHAVEVQVASEFFGDEIGYLLCPEGFSRDTVVYSCGVGKNVDFDLALIRRFGMTIHAFDPTPRCLEWVQQQALPAEFRFHPYGVADYDGTAHFHPPIREGAPDFTVIEREERGVGPAVEAQVRRLGTLMQELGHSRLDLLKLDIEGAEYPVIADLVNAGLPVSQILIEFHHRWPEFGEAKTREAVDLLRSAGFRIFSISKNRDYSLIRVPPS